MFALFYFVFFFPLGEKAFLVVLPLGIFKGYTYFFLIKNTGSKVISICVSLKPAYHIFLFDR